MVIFWADEDAQYIRTRSRRYPGALDIEPDWTREVLADVNVVELTPYPGSRVGASGFVGYSSSAERVLVGDCLPRSRWRLARSQRVACVGS